MEVKETTKNIHNQFRIVKKHFRQRLYPSHAKKTA